MIDGPRSGAINQNQVLDLPTYVRLDDFTRYVSASPRSKPGKANIERIRKLLTLDSGAQGVVENYSYSDNIYPTSGARFRSLVCPCFQKKYYSLTLRRLPPGKVQLGKLQIRREIAYESVRNRPWTSKSAIQSGYYAPETEPPEPHLFGLHEYVKVLFETVFTPEKFEEHSGLVIIAGTTSSGKSRITRGIIYRYLSELIRLRIAPSSVKPSAKDEDICKPRRPHFVTFEDPIEALYYEDPKTAINAGLDYTPRQKGIDAAGLMDVLLDCLRQTPAAVYVGETRKLSDWRSLVEFAGTGHLVFTTCHAGSLTEVLGTLCTAMGADTAAKRSALASRLLAVIQLRRCTLEIEDKRSTAIPLKETTLPALLRRSPTGINAITSDGLAAVLPHASVEKNQKVVPQKGQAQAQESVGRYCYGRTYFAAKLLEISRKRFAKRRKPYLKEYTEELKKRACQFDLEGL